MNLPVLALLGSAFPLTTFWSCLSLPAPSSSAQNVLSPSILSTSFSSEPPCTGNITQYWGFFPCAAPQPSLFSFCAAPGLVLIRICFSHLLCTCFHQFPRWESASCPTPCIPQSKAELASSGPRRCQEHRLSVCHNKQMDPVQPGVRRHREDVLIPWLESADFSMEKTRRTSIAPALLPPAQSRSMEGRKDK